MSLRGHSRSALAAATTERVLIVTSGPIMLAISATAIDGFLPLEETTTGLVTVRGVSYPISDLARWLSRPRTDQARESRVVLCGSRGRHRGFRVDQVLGLTTVDLTQIRPLPPHFMGEERTWYKGVFLYRDGVALWANPEWLVGPDVGGDPLLRRLDATGLEERRAIPSGAIIEVEAIHAERTA